MTFGICIESSHQKGMGHLFRAMHFCTYLRSKGDSYIIFINPHKASLDCLRDKGLSFETVDPTDSSSGWESTLASRHNLDVWINDRLDTNEDHARRVKLSGLKLITFDDHGTGAALSDLHVASMAFDDSEQALGHKVLRGVDYLILNPEISSRRRLRRRMDRIVVSLGGSDTYGVTVKAAIMLKELGQPAVIHIGPAFAHREALQANMGGEFILAESVASLVELFSGFDLAITGGGVTPFEANAAGLPALIIANELFEIPNGRFLHSAGSSYFLGYHENLESKTMSKGLAFASSKLNDMSKRGMDRFCPQDAFERIYSEIQNV